jgi:hypothetical protein
LLMGLDDALALLPDANGDATSAEIRQRLARARGWFDNGDLARLVAELPGLLAIAHEAAGRGRDPVAYTDGQLLRPGDRDAE